MKVETETYFLNGNTEPSVADFMVFCRFCYSDFIGWVEDPTSIGDYPLVHRWQVADDQLDAVREDTETRTTPGNIAQLDEVLRQVYVLLQEIEDDESEEYELGVPLDPVRRCGEAEGLERREVDAALQRLKETGWVEEPTPIAYRSVR